MSDAAGALSGRAAVVTGASRGIGLATARALAAAGAQVVMLARTREELAARAAEIGDRAVGIACDVTDADAVDSAAREAARSLGRAPDILVNNAGAFVLAQVDRMETTDFARTIGVNLVAPFQLVRTFLPAMRERGAGHIVTIGSIADRVAFPENGAYAASKFGLRALHEVMRAELRGTGVRASLVSPGPVDTPLWDAVAPETRPGFTPRSAMLTAAAVADAVLYVVTRPVDANIDELRLSRA
jgi:NADP-dependent 3-hydroxy acid dehydrogenase YdfG